MPDLENDELEAPRAPEVRPTDFSEFDEVDETPPTPQPKADDSEKINLIKTLEAMQQKINANDGAVAKVVADPLVREVLRLKEAGKKIKIVEDEPAQPITRQPEQPSKPLNEMTNAELVEYFAKQTDAKVEAQLASVLNKLRSDLESATKPLAERVNLLSSEAQDRRSKSVEDQITAAKEKYSDFAQVQPLMVEVNKAVAGLSVEELYHLAKLRSGLPPVTQKQIESERPQTPPRERQALQVKPSHLKGKRGFTELLDAALQRN